jgi:tRNA modification GTPase
MNRLLGYDRSIVTEIAGTTRDTVTESVEINGTTYHFTDTAGLNDTPDKVEKIGINKTIESLKSADIILLLIEPGNDKKTDKYLKDNNLSYLLKDKKTILASTKSDIAKAKGISISAKTGAGIPELIKQITKHSNVESVGSLQILTTRQLNILSRVEQTLVSLQDNIASLTNDIISSEIQASIADLNELTGDQATSQIIDSIFRNFCIGK